MWQKSRCYTGVMTTSISMIERLSDDELLTHLKRAAKDERCATAHLIVLLTEVDARRLYLAQGCSSLFTYCTRVLHLSEHAAFGRIEAARTARRFPLILERLLDGSLNLTAIGLLGRHLTSDNHVAVLDAARHKSKSDVEHIVARLRPRADARVMVRKLPEARSATPPASIAFEAALGDESASPVRAVPPPPPRRSEVKPLAPERYKIQFTVDRETHDKLRRAQDLLRHTIPDGDPAKIFARALSLLLEDVCRKKLAASERPRPAAPRRPDSRNIPAAVRRTVWKRDGGRCVFRGVRGRCGETGFLEFHHVRPFADGGPATTENIELRCRAHNAYEAELDFGSERHRSRGACAREETEARKSVRT
jgi:hypothetical protein